MTEQDLIDAGYRKHKSDDIVYQYSDYFYQKKINDEKGVKYFIQFVHYPAINIDNTGVDEAWMLELATNEPHYRFQKHRINAETVDGLQKECELFWVTFKCEYYQLNHEN